MNVKTDTTVVTERGQTSIPAHLRKEMGLGRGKRLVWEKVSDEEIRIWVRPSTEVDPVAMLGFARRVMPWAVDTSTDSSLATKATSGGSSRRFRSQRPAAPDADRMKTAGRCSTI
jgi:AbrB family looped-hinge helix DNA binding protein